MRVPPDQIDLHLVNSEDELAAFRAWVPEGEYVACDTETTGLQPFGPKADHLRLVQFGDENVGWAIPTNRVGSDRGGRGIVGEALDRFSGRLVGHNATFDESFLSEAGFATGPKWSDTYIAHHLLYPLDWHGLKPAAAQFYGREVRTGEKWLDNVKRANHWDWATIPVEHPAYWGYSALDTVLTARLANDLLPQVEARFAAQYDRELRVSKMMRAMTRRGLPIDMDYAEQLLAKWAAEEQVLRARLEKYAIQKPGSAAQIVAALENDGWEPDVFTDGGKPSVNRSVLEGLDHEIATTVLRWRRITKWSQSYLVPLLETGGRLHFQINSLRAATGRMSIDTPPLQQFPTGPEVRSVVLAEPGQELWAVDYTGQEMRLLAAFAEDPELTEAVLNGQDVHGRIALEIHGAGYTKEQRKWTKNGLYAWSYGAGDSKLAMTAHAPASRFKNAVGRAYPGILRLMNGVLAKARERQESDGMAWARTLGGRVVAVPKTRHYALTNYLMQGSGSDLLKTALLKIEDAGLGESICLTVHDEVLANFDPKDGKEKSQIIVDCLTTEFRGVPFDAHATGPGKSWGELV